jgi:GDP-L-fucose synthase
MNILVTGGSGFIGRNIVEYLSLKHHVLAPSHSELDLMNEHNVCDYFLSHNIDIVIHSAVKPAQRSAPDRSQILYNNTRMLFNILRDSHNFEKLIYLSSGAIYDMENYIPKMPESYFDRHVPTDEYGFSKYLSAKHIERLDNTVELRLFGVFGKYEDYSIRFISNAICKAIFDLPITIKQNRRFDYLYISDYMPILDYFINNKGKHCAYNVTPNEAIDLYSLAEKVRKISGKDLPIVVNRTGMGTEYSGDNQRLRAEIKDLDYTPIDDAIEELYLWYTSNINIINRNSLLIDI